MFNPTNCLLLSAFLFAAGLYGVMARRNLLVVLMSVELMLNAANLAFLTFARLHGGAAGTTGHVFVLMTIGVAAAEVAIGLALVIALFRTRQTLDTSRLKDLHH
jgi:NADH-quinone oxidoreductase subunit K